MKRCSQLAAALCGALVVATSVAFARSISVLSQNEFTNSLLVESEVTAIGWLILVIASVLLLSESVRRLRQLRVGESKPLSKASWYRRSLAWVTGLIAVNASGVSAVSPHTISSRSVSLDGVLSPIAASAVLSHIIRRRREQLADRVSPDVLTVAESEALGRIQEQARRNVNVQADTNELVVTPEVRSLLMGVERVCPVSVRHEVVEPSHPWLVEVKLFGYPMAVSVDGSVAEFRKKRSLELLTWLALNRNRARRTAARTAMWDIDVSDASFSTVVSDLRRALRDAVHDSDDINFLPTTYSDELPLSHLVVTDADRLQSEYERFMESHTMTGELRRLLGGMRDIPLAGTTYSWADLDGTTTRLVMSALIVTEDIAQVCLDTGVISDALLATAAGLRVFPGCEELLDLQQQCLAHVAHKQHH